MAPLRPFVPPATHIEPLHAKLLIVYPENPATKIHFNPSYE